MGVSVDNEEVVLEDVVLREVEDKSIVVVLTWGGGVFSWKVVKFS